MIDPFKPAVKKKMYKKGATHFPPTSRSSGEIHKRHVAREVDTERKCQSSETALLEGKFKGPLGKTFKKTLWNPHKWKWKECVWGADFLLKLLQQFCILLVIVFTESTTEHSHTRYFNPIFHFTSYLSQELGISSVHFKSGLKQRQIREAHSHKSN